MQKNRFSSTGFQFLASRLRPTAVANIRGIPISAIFEWLCIRRFKDAQLTELIIDFDNIKDPAKKERLLHTLKLMGIGFQATEQPQTITQYNEDIAAGDAEIERGDLITAADLKIEARKW